MTERQQAEYSPKYQRFLVTEKRFTQQYSHLYMKRTEIMKPTVQRAACTKWSIDTTAVAKKLLDVRVHDDVVVVGTLYKEMPLKPNVLQEFTSKLQGPPPARANYCSAEDELVLEDESGRVTLTGVDHLKHQVVTGVVMAIKGHVGEDGKLQVKDVCTAGVPMSKPLMERPLAGDGPYVVLLSGLDLGTRAFNPVPLMMLAEYVQGCLGSDADADTVSGIVRVVVCGGIVRQDNKDFTDKVLSAADQALLAEPLVTGDVVLSSIAAAVPLDVMPGESDPSNYTMPQQPLHRCLLPLTSRFSSYRPVTNPYDAEVHSVRFLGSSGQAVDDIVRYTEEDVLSSVDADGDVDAAGRAVDAAVDAAGPGAGAGAAPGSDAAGGSPAGDGAKATAASPSRAITALERSLTWRHLAPTAPDTLACYPFFDHDPFVIDTAPHIMFSGNHNAFATKHIKPDHGPGTHLVTVPSFSSTGTAVLVNLTTLECTPMTFGAAP